MARLVEAAQIDVHVGMRLRRQRKLAGMSQQAVGKILGVSLQQIQKYEKGVNRITAGRLFILARLLDMDVADFFDGVPRKGTRNPTAKDRTLKRVVEFIQTQEGLRLNLAYLDTKDKCVRKCVLVLLTA